MPPHTLGEALKKRRLDLGLLQREVADLLGVNTNTVTNWEVRRHSPSLTWSRKLNAFLGKSQWPITPGGPPQTLGAAIRQRRLEQGPQQKDLTPLLGVKPGEKSSEIPSNLGKEVILLLVRQGGKETSRRSLCFN